MLKKLKREFGKHYLVEFIDCQADKLHTVRDVKKPFLTAAKHSQATVLKSFFYQFKPSGVTGIIFIAESHFSIHTWPEDRYVAFDILTCGRMYPQKAISYLRKFFKAKRVNVRVIPRGF